jgi:hypothetical protein
MGAILSLLSSALGIFNTLVGAWRDKGLRDQGAADQRLSDVQTQVKATSDALQAANRTTDSVVSDKLRDGSF